jgi:hypothetical protein
MSYSFEALSIDKTKINYLQKCFYVMNLIKAKDHEMWEIFKEQYEHTKPEDSWEFFQFLVDEYKKLQSPPAPVKEKAVLKLVAEEKKASPMKKKLPVKKKAPSKKKAPAKKAPAKKKAPTKKAAPKKKATKKK